MSVQVQRSPVFRRNGVNIHSDVLISIAQAILGGTATTQGLYETISIVVSKEQGCTIYTIHSITAHFPLQNYNAESFQLIFLN